MAPGRPDSVCSRCIGSPQTTRERPPFAYPWPARPAGRRTRRLLRRRTHLLYAIDVDLGRDGQAIGTGPEPPYCSARALMISVTLIAPR